MKRHTAHLFFVLGLFAVTSASAQTIVYVDDNAPPGGDGQSWATAYTDLQSAFAAPGDGDGELEIRVAGGTYKPSAETEPGDPRTATFTTRSGVALRGGYRGLAGGGDPDDRDIAAFITVLSGDIGVEMEPSDNCYHVVTAGGTDESAVLDGLTITGGNADGVGGHRVGGAISCSNGAPTIAYCTIIDNSAELDGGGLHTTAPGGPVLDHCVFRHCSAGRNGGGIFSSASNGFTVTNGAFSQNQAGSGGGMYCGGASPTITDCAFDENQANRGGGLSSGSTTITGCAFRSNAAGLGGGGVFDAGDNTFLNCTFSGNTGGSGGGILTVAVNSKFYNCIIAGNYGERDGGGMYASSDPLSVVNCIFWENFAPIGPQIHDETGFAAAVTFSCVQGGWSGKGNIDRNPAFVDITGADFQLGTADDDLHLRADSPCVNAGDNSVIPVGSTDYEGEDRIQQCRVDMGIDESPYLGLDCNSNGIADACDVADGISPDCNTNSIPDECEVGGLEDCNANGTSDLCDIFQGISSDCNNNGIPDECEQLPVGLFYVDDDSTAGLGNGADWDNAFTELADALAFLDCVDAVGEIRVAAGTYKPTAETEPGDQRSASFTLRNGISIRGGYRGLDGTGDPAIRDVARFPTVLSGDLGATDQSSDNSYHVVITSGTNATAVLDGVTVANGNANGLLTVSQVRGAGLYNVGGSPMLIDCVFRDNLAGNFFVEERGFGAGMYSQGDSHPLLVNCDFILNYNTVPFSSGGGLYNLSGDPTLVNCQFRSNGASYGAGMYNGGSPTLFNCEFMLGFGPDGNGGGIFNGGSPTLTNCVFVRNSVEWEGSAIWNSSATASPKLTNCIVWQNSGFDGTLGQIDGGSSIVNYSCVEHGWPGVGNIAADPRFISLDGTEPNLRLQPDSPCVNAGSPLNDDGTGVPPVLPETDADGYPRVLCGRVDMGAYERGIGDHDCDDDIDLDDFAAWDNCMGGPANDSLSEGCAAYEFVFDGHIDLRDFALYQERFTAP